MGTENHRWLERLIPSFRRMTGEVLSLRANQDDLVAVTRNLEAQTATLRRQVELLENTNTELREQVERRDQIGEELQARMRKQQAIIEKLTTRLEAVRLERKEVYEQYNRLLAHTSASERSAHGFHPPQTADSKEQSISAAADGEAWRLNMGCGRVKKSGYLNVDIDVSVKPDLVVSLDSALPFASGSFALIEAYHVIEHVYPWVSLDIVKELWRILKPEGKLAIECPNVESACTWLVHNSDYGCDSQMGMWAIYGDPNPQNPLHMHRWGYTPVTLAGILKQAGFASIIREVPETHVPARDFRMTAIKS